MKLFRIFIYLIAFFTLSFSNDLIQKDLNDKSLTINNSTYKIIEFDKMVKNIKVNDKEIIEVDFIDNTDKPLQSIKIFAKTLGYGNILVTFVDSTTINININIVNNIKEILNIAKQLSPNLTIKQINNKFLLEGEVQNQKIKDSIINLFKNSKIELKDQLIDLSTVKNPDNMIRIKLYVVEIDNNKSKEITNDWTLLPLYDFFFGDDKLVGNIGYDSTISLSGGLSSIANRLGSKFNVGYTLNYLESKDIAKVLDETTLITLENNESVFHSGGTINARTSTADTIQFTQIDYGLKMKINVQEIIDSQYIKLLIDTESSSIDDNIARVDDIPAIKNKTISTNVIVTNLSTIVLGGLINIGNVDYEEKIPLLGDIPIIGKAFTSSSKTKDNKELVFFITPEIVDPKVNNQLNILNEKTVFTKDFKTSPNEPKEKTREEALNSDASDLSEHERRVKEFLGY